MATTIITLTPPLQAPALLAPNAVPWGIGCSFLFTNECHSSSYSHVEFAGKRILGVAGGGDHLIGSMARGCSSYIAFDVSAYACLFSALKMAALQGLSYREFLDFFSPPHRSKKSFSPALYDRIRKMLPRIAQYFFDETISAAKTKQLAGWQSALDFITVEEWPSGMGLFYIPYLRSERAFEEAKKAAGKHDYMPIICADIRDLGEHVEGSFDLIYLSNVIQTLADDYGIDAAMGILGKLQGKLSEGGAMLLYGMHESVSLMNAAGFVVSVIRPDAVGWLETMGRYALSMLKQYDPGYHARYDTLYIVR